MKYFYLFIFFLLYLHIIEAENKKQQSPFGTKKYPFFRLRAPQCNGGTNLCIPVCWLVNPKKKNRQWQWYLNAKESDKPFNARSLAIPFFYPLFFQACYHFFNKDPCSPASFFGHPVLSHRLNPEAQCVQSPFLLFFSTFIHFFLRTSFVKKPCNK